MALVPLGGGARRAPGGAALEALDAATGIDELLAARVERMAVRADLDVDLGLGRSRRELVSAGAADVRLDVLGMDLGLHRGSSVAAGWRRPGCRMPPTRPPASRGERAGAHHDVVGLVALVDLGGGVRRQADGAARLAHRPDERDHLLLARVQAAEALGGLPRAG